MDAGPAETLQEVSEGEVGEGAHHIDDAESIGFGSAPEHLAQTHVDEDHDDMNRAEELVEGLENGLVHAQPQANAEIQRGGGAEKGEERADRADRQRGGEFVRGDALGEQVGQRGDEAAAPERRASPDGGGRRDGSGWDHADGKRRFLAPSR